MDILKIFSSEDMMNYARAVEQPPMLGETLFPSTKIEGFEFSYIKGAKNLPVAASIHAFDTEAEVAARDGMVKVTQDLAMVKRKIRMNERELLVLNTSTSNAALDAAKRTLFDDGLRMLTSVKTRFEVMRMQALTEGIVTLSNENGIAIPFDYGVPAGNKVTLSGTSLWSDLGSTPLEDIFDWTNQIEDTYGVTLTRALTSNKVIQTLLKHPAIRKAAFGVNSDRLMTLTELNALLSSQGLPTIVKYDARYRALNKAGQDTTARYFPENKFVLMPSEKLGDTAYGVTPEEVELRNQGVQIEQTDNVVITTYGTVDPVAKWTKATAIGMPAFLKLTMCSKQR